MTVWLTHLRFADEADNKGLFLKDPEDALETLRAVATSARLHAKDGVVQRYGNTVARGLGFESLAAIRRHVTNQDKVRSVVAFAT